MNLVLATIATIFLLVPGFAFVTGVNISDKNIREIVFRGTPAELAYVVAVSVIVHLVFAWAPATHFNPANLVNDYLALTGIVQVGLPKADATVFEIVRWSLLYFFVSALAGGALGLALGWAVRRWHWRFFIKHRWMVMLVRLSDRDTVYAYAVLTPSFEQGDDAAGKDLANGATVIQGWIRDCFFAADGTLLYLVFSSFQDSKVTLAENNWLRALPQGGSPDPMRKRTSGRLVIEGRNIAFVQYEPVELRPSLSDIKKALAAGPS